MKFKLFVFFTGLLLAHSPLQAGPTIDRSAYIGFTPVSAYAPSFLSPSVEVGAFLGSSWVFSLESGGSKFNFGHEETFEEHHNGGGPGNWGHMLEERWESQENLLELPTDSLASGNHSRAGAKARWLLGENLNLVLGTHQTRTTAHLKIPVAATTLSTTGDLIAESQTQSLGIGSHWVLGSGLFVGVDWAVLTRLQGSSVTVSLQDSPSLSPAQQQTAHQQITAFGESINRLMARSGGLQLWVAWGF